MANNACDYSQHVAGSENIVADCLSRDFHLTDKKILSLLHNLVPHLLPPNPQIISLPTHLSSWIATIAQLEPKKRELNWQCKPSTIAAGVSGWSSNKNQTYMTPTWTHTRPSIKPVSYAPSWMQSGTEPSHDWIPLKEPLWPRPSTMWLRPLPTVVGTTQDRIKRSRPT